MDRSNLSEWIRKHRGSDNDSLSVSGKSLSSRPGSVSSISTQSLNESFGFYSGKSSIKTPPPPSRKSSSRSSVSTVSQASTLFQYKPINSIRKPKPLNWRAEGQAGTSIVSGERRLSKSEGEMLKATSSEVHSDHGVPESENNQTYDSLKHQSAWINCV